MERKNKNGAENKLRDIYTRRSTSDAGSINALMKGNNRLGATYVNNNNNGSKTYGAVLDNTPFTNTVDNSIRTPLGEIGYGSDTGSVYANYTTPIESIHENNANEYGDRWDSYTYNGIPNTNLEIGRWSNPNPAITPEYGMSISNPLISRIGNRDFSAETPIGNFYGGVENGDTAYASYEPNQSMKDATTKFLQLLSSLRR